MNKCQQVGKVVGQALSGVRATVRTMKNHIAQIKPRVVARVQMEPELEALAGELPAAERASLGIRLVRWGRVLQISAVVLTDPPPRGRQQRRALLAALADRAAVAELLGPR